MQTLGYEYIGKTYAICLENSLGKLVYMNGIRHASFPVDSTAHYTDFIVDIYQTIGDLVADYRLHYAQERNVRLVYGDVYFHTESGESIVLSRNSLISKCTGLVRRYLRKIKQDIQCRSHPYSTVFYEWKGRYPTYDEFNDILCKIRL